MLKEIVANDVTILGKFSTQAFPLTVYGNITIAPEIECTIEHLNVQGGLATTDFGCRRDFQEFSDRQICERGNTFLTFKD